MQLLQSLDPKFPVCGTALLASDFEAIGAYREEPFFRTALGLRGVPSTNRLRQRLDALAGTRGAGGQSTNFANGCCAARRH